MSVSFTTPLALLGLLTLPVIIVLHMLRYRRHVFPVSSLSLWRFLNPQLSGTAPRRIPLSWLLFIDLLIAALISLALAGPQLDLAQTIREGRHLVLILDTSTSMAAVDERPSRLETAKGEVRSLVSAGIEQDAVTIIGFNTSANTIGDSRTEGLPILLNRLGEVRAGGAGANLDAALALARASIDPELPAEIHIFTDGAYKAPEFSAFDIPLTWHVYGSSGNNQAVLAVQAVVLSELRYQVFTRAANFGPDEITRDLVLSSDGQALTSVRITFPPGSSIVQTWEMTGSARKVSVHLLGEDGLPLDDAAFTTVEPAIPDQIASDRIDIALVSHETGPVLRALESAPNTSVQVIAPEVYLPGSRFDMVVFQRFLPERWPGTVTLVLEPPPESSLLGRVSAVQVSELPFPQPDLLLTDVDFTGVRWGTVWVPARVPPGIEPIMEAGPTRLILHGQTGLTELVLLLAQTSDENGTPTAFARHPSFPVLIANIVQQAAGARLPRQVAAGTPIDLPDFDHAAAVRVVLPDLTAVALGTDRSSRAVETGTPGFYDFTFTNLEGRESHISVGVNAGDLAESNILPGDWPAQVLSPPSPLTTTQQPVSLVPWILAAVGILLLLEAWVSWR